MSTENTADAEFLRDVATHELNVIRDDGLYRHLRFRRPGTSCMYFDLITWPGHLCYTGDMGTYVFSRISDMLEFFRRDTQGEKLPINSGYWSEKVLAVDGGRSAASVFEYDHSKYLAVVDEYLAEWLEGLSEEHQEELKEAVQDEVLHWADDNDEHGNYRRAYEFSAEVDGRTYQFTDFFERNMRRFTDRFIWCCRALVWGIDQYDQTKSASGYMAGAPLLTTAAQDVLAERNRQITAEGWTPAHDDEHGFGEMAAAAGFYALHAHDPERSKKFTAPQRWPWDFKWWKPGPARRMLVKAGALILAEIERLDRVALAGKEGQA